MKQKPMGRLHPGRYRMRNGNVAEVWGRTADGPLSYPFFGSLPDSPDDDAWSAGGRNIVSSAFDLVERIGPLKPAPKQPAMKRKPPTERKGWVVVWPDGRPAGILFGTKDAAQALYPGWQVARATLRLDPPNPPKRKEKR